MSVRIYLIRHCQTGGNKQRLFQGRMDADISEEGARQLELLAERFKDIRLDAVYSSPLLRARRTAEAVVTYRPLPIRQDPRLIEIDVGVWEGKPWEVLLTAYPEQCRLWMQEPWQFQATGGEPMEAVYARMKEALLDIAAAHPGKVLAVISHGCAIRNALCFARGWPITRLNEVDWCGNTGVSTLEIEGKDVRLICENDRTHLPDASALTGGWWK